MKEAIQSIIASEIKSGQVFDAHTIIAYLLQKNSDLYLSSVGNYKSTDLYHSHIATVIASFEEELITRIEGKSWSKNIHDNFTECTCWQKR